MRYYSGNKSSLDLSTLADPGGAKDECAPPGPISFIFDPNSGDGDPWEILDPPLVCDVNTGYLQTGMKSQK